MIKTFTYNNKFTLENKTELDSIQIGYSIYGDPNAEKTIWVCHALSGNSEVFDWWAGIFGPECIFNPSEYRIICANVLGGCYGSTGPSSFEDPESFPLITVRDMFKAHQLLADELNIKTIDILIGPSLGGQQALEWAIADEDRVNQLILIASNAVHSPQGIAFNEAQRMALKTDPTFGRNGGGEDGLKAARAIAMISYRSYKDFEIKQTDEYRSYDGYKAASYIQYQGEKFVGRFDPVSYYRLSQAMDSHDVSRGRKASVQEVLSRVKCKTLVVGVDSDVLFPLSEQQFLADHIPGAQFAVIHSVHGHDAFLIEYKKLNSILSGFLLGGQSNVFARNAARKTTLKRKNLILTL